MIATFGTETEGCLDLMHYHADGNIVVSHRCDAKVGGTVECEECEQQFTIGTKTQLIPYAEEPPWIGKYGKTGKTCAAFQMKGTFLWLDAACSCGAPIVVLGTDFCYLLECLCGIKYYVPGDVTLEEVRHTAT